MLCSRYVYKFTCWKNEEGSRITGYWSKYLEATVKKEVAPTPAQLIDMRSYGRMDGAAVLKQAMDLIEANK